jgi:hypothetical protein
MSPDTLPPTSLAMPGLFSEDVAAASHRCYSLEEVEGFLSGYGSAAEHFALPSLKFEFEPPHPFRGQVYEP